MNLNVGIFVCECGGNISNVINVEKVVGSVRNWEHVKVCKRYTYLCSIDGQEGIVDAIKKFKLDRILVAACTPRIHLSTFQNVLERAGLNPYFLEFINIREQVSWVHGPKPSEEATKKAIILIRGGYERCLELEPLKPLREKCVREVLVVGGGIGGITAALEIARMGYKVHLLEKEPTIGGNMAKLTKLFPTLDCAQCILAPKMLEVWRNPNVNLLVNSEIREVSGTPGNYLVTVFVKPRGVDLDKCKSCGACSKVCPASAPDEFNCGLSNRKAIYLPFPQSVPPAYVVDFKTCIRCGKCLELCPVKAINLDDKGKTIKLSVGAIIIATGYELYDAGKLEKYGYGLYPDVITMLTLERLTSAQGPTGGYVKKADGSPVRRLAIVLCAGSRDENHVPYCSRICCMYSLKHAYVLKKMLGIDVTVYYIDVRASGKGCEELYKRCQEAGVNFVRGKVSEIEKRNGKLVVLAEDTLINEVREEEYDMVVLAVPMIPHRDFAKTAELMGLQVGEDGFGVEKHPKLDPVDSLKMGIFICGCASGPKDVRDTVSEALAAAARVASFLGSGYITVSPEKAFVVEELCDGCGFCIKMCPVNALYLKNKKAEVNPFICEGCGACVSVCSRGAIDLKNNSLKQILANVRGVLWNKDLDEVRIIAFVDKRVGYIGIDFLGIDHIAYPENVIIIPVPSTALIGLNQVLYSFAYGADGLLLIEGQENINRMFGVKKVENLICELERYGIERMRVRYTHVPLPTYKKASEIINLFAERIRKLGPLQSQTRENIKKYLTSALRCC
jgi:heterodisulfide reductase subunit A